MWNLRLPDAEAGVDAETAADVETPDAETRGVGAEAGPVETAATGLAETVAIEARAAVGEMNGAARAPTGRVNDRRYCYRNKASISFLYRSEMTCRLISCFAESSFPTSKSSGISVIR